MSGTPSPVSRERRPFLIGAVVLTAAVSLLQIPVLTLAAAALAGFVFWFFRDPERVIPADERHVLSPADGRVVGIVGLEEDRLLKGPAIRISIFLNVFNVHVNRVPVSGKILNIVYQPGLFKMAQVPEASLNNEQNALLLESPSGMRIVFVQIAGFIARRIVCWARTGDTLRQGERFGMIRFGSRTDIYVPPTTRIRVKPGDRVQGGVSVLGELT